MVGRAAAEGLSALTPEQLADREAKAAARRDQEGIGAAVATGVESALGAATNPDDFALYFRGVSGGGAKGNALEFTQ